MSGEDDDKADEKEAAAEINFHFIKANSFRVVHCDGAFGGPSPAGSCLHMSVFNERSALPLQITHEVQEGSRIGPEKSRLVRDGIVREVEFDAIMSWEAAKKISDWLSDQVAKHQERVSERDSQQAAKASISKRRRRKRKT